MYRYVMLLDIVSADSYNFKIQIETLTSNPVGTAVGFFQIQVEDSNYIIMDIFNDTLRV